MRARTTGALAFTVVLGVAGPLATTARAQDPVVFSSDECVECDHPAQGHGWCFGKHHPPIPRTFSYLYNYNFNQPRHFRVIGCDGRKYWTTAVRGLPLGTPWPSY
jgi:hypothetical protein